MAKTLDEGFSTFLSWLVPLESEHNKSVSHKSSVKSCLVNNFECYSFFETGSFGNGTGVRHYSDTDYFAACPSKKLKQNSASTLRELKTALQETFWNTGGIEVDSPAVKIPFGKYKSETLEVTPCSYEGMIDTPHGSKPLYDIADGDGGWMKSSPAAHNAYVKYHDERLGGRLKPLIRLVKAWKFYNSVPIISFYLELRVTKYAEKESAIVYDIDLRHIMKLMYDGDLPMIQDPMGVSGYIRACTSDSKKLEALSKVKTGFTRADKAYDKRSSNVDDAFYWWNLFFNDGFPAR